MANINLLSAVFLKQQPKAAAELLREFPPEHAAEFVQQVPLPELIPLIDHMANWPAARLLSLMPEKQVAKILCGIAAADAETLLRLMSRTKRIAVLRHMPGNIGKNFTRKLAFPVTTVGAWMDTSIPCFTLDSSVNDCLDLVKRQKTHLGGVVILVDERRHLMGLVEVENLLTSDGKQPLSGILSAEIEALPARATLWEAEGHDGWTRFPTLPVVDRDNILLGALTHAALRAGTARSAESSTGPGKFSLVSHMSKGFYIAMIGLLHIIMGTGAGNNVARQQSFPPPGDKRAGGY